MPGFADSYIAAIVASGHLSLPAVVPCAVCGEPCETGVCEECS